MAKKHKSNIAGRGPDFQDQPKLCFNVFTNTYNQQKLSAKFYKNGYWSLTGQSTAIRGFFFVILVKWAPPPTIYAHLFNHCVPDQGYCFGWPTHPRQGKPH